MRMFRVVMIVTIIVMRKVRAIEGLRICLASLEFNEIVFPTFGRVT